MASTLKRKIVWSERALREIAGIYEFIAYDSERNAAAFTVKLVAAINNLADNPGIGRMVPEIGDLLLREKFFRNYRIVYKIFTKEIKIVSIAHCSKLLHVSFNDL